MIRILISEEAFAAIGGGDLEAQRLSGSERYGLPPAGLVPIWLTKAVVEALNANRRSSESMSDVVLRFTQENTQ